ncbi:MAG: hypothetical protein OPY05_00030, partial [Nitrosopumilus sp.]|nr:hypothetical protein [Nitrosopumilus sp.]
EQILISEKLDSVKSYCSNIRSILSDCDLKCTFLYKQILKQAFEGKLVPQDPKDESASILLERIKKEKIPKSQKPF